MYCIVFGHVTIICLFLALLQFDTNIVVVNVVIVVVVFVVVFVIVVVIVVFLVVVVVIVVVVVFYFCIHFGHVTIICPY